MKVVALLLLMCGWAMGQTTQPSDRVEFVKANTMDGVDQVQVTFYRNITPANAEHVLRTELQRIVDSKRSDTDEIIATAWNGVGKSDGDEDQICLSDGSGSLVYVVKTQKTLTFKQYGKMKGASTRP